MRAILAMGALVLVAGTSLARADVYRWVDRQGSVHYSDRWVEGSERIKTTKSAATMAASARAADERAKLTASNERIDNEFAQRAAERAVQQDVAKVRAEQCKEAKLAYEKAVRARRIFRTGKDGEREYLSEAEIDEHRLAARKEMDSTCGPQR